VEGEFRTRLCWREGLDGIETKPNYETTDCRRPTDLIEGCARSIWIEGVRARNGGERDQLPVTASALSSDMKRGTGVPNGHRPQNTNRAKGSPQRCGRVEHIDAQLCSRKSGQSPWLRLEARFRSLFFEKSRIMASLDLSDSLLTLTVWAY